MQLKAWMPVEHSGRAQTKTEQAYSKVEGESLGIINGVKKHKKYLYGTQFEVLVDHELLVSLYNKKKELNCIIVKFDLEKCGANQRKKCFDRNEFMKKKYESVNGTPIYRIEHEYQLKTRHGKGMRRYAQIGH